MIGITGSTGEVGGKVLQTLLKSGVKVCVFLRDMKQSQQFSGKNIEFRLFNFLNPNFDVLQGITQLFWILPNDHKQLQLIKQEKDWITLAKQAGIKHIVKLSAMLVEKHDFFFHRQSELNIEESGIFYTHLRANTFMQNFNNYDIDDIKVRQALYYPAGEGKMSFIDTRDIAEVATKILLKPEEHINKGYMLTALSALNYYEIARIFTDELKTDIVYYDTCQFPEKELFANNINNKINNEFYKAVREGLFATVSVDAAEILNRNPITLERYVRDYREYFLN